MGAQFGGSYFDETALGEVDAENEDLYGSVGIRLQLERATTMVATFYGGVNLYNGEQSSCEPQIEYY